MDFSERYGLRPERLLVTLLALTTAAFPAAAQEADAPVGAGASSSPVAGSAAWEPWSAEQLQSRAALIYTQHVGFSLVDARERGIGAAEQGRRIGEIVAQGKQRIPWHPSSNALIANAVAKMIDGEYELDIGRATFTLRSPYARAARELERYGSNMDEYVAWLQAMHDGIGPVQGYAMTARLDGPWLVETYRDLPERMGLEPATDLTAYEPSPAELRRVAGVYRGGRVGDATGAAFLMRVWIEDTRVRVAAWRAGQREPWGRHLVPVERNHFMPGWYADDGTVEVQHNARMRFAGGGGPAEWLELETFRGTDVTVWRLVRLPESGAD